MISSQHCGLCRWCWYVCMKKVGGKTCGKYHCGFLHRHTKPVSNLTINNTANDDKSTAEAVQPQN